MQFTEYRKETSERSDKDNWAKKLLVEQSGYFIEGIEGCSQNADNVVTHLVERARVDCNIEGKQTLENIFQRIKELESERSLIRKLKFASLFNIPLSYVLYCNELKKVWLFSIEDIDKIALVQTYNSYEDFANWIYSIKGWYSSKSYRESDDLPDFDKALRIAKTPWPTNIDGIISDQEDNPIGILEYQNAEKTKVSEHCNNDYFLCLIKRMKEGQYGPYPVYHDDIRRWTSQEILRVQSSLQFYVITWSKDDLDFILKEIEVITIPYIPEGAGWKVMNAYKSDLHNYISGGKPTELETQIANSYRTFNFEYSKSEMHLIVNDPPTSYGSKTFPSIYYRYKQLIEGKREQLLPLFKQLIEK